MIRTILGTFAETVKPSWVHLIDARTLDAYRRERLRAQGIRGGKISPQTVKKELRHLPCPRADEPDHECGGACGLYGFHAFRGAHARFNYANPELQNQLGHACAATIDHYRRWAARQAVTYGAYLPAGLDSGKAEPKQRENGGKDGGKPALRVVSA